MAQATRPTKNAAKARSTHVRAINRTPKWTVMVFMGADTVGTAAPLQDSLRNDLEEMAFIGSGETLNILVQVHGMREVPLRGRIEQGPLMLAPVPRSERALTGGKALEQFVRWALARAEHDLRNPAHHSMLVFWGHAYDFAFGRARRKDGSVDALDFVELSDVLHRLQSRYPMADAKLDILAFDACDVATVEMAYQMKPFVRYLLGSQIGVPAPGWPYDRILGRLRYPFGKLMSPAEFGAFVVRRFCEAYDSSNPVSLTLLDLRRTDELFTRARRLADRLVTAARDPDMRDWFAYLFTRSQTFDGKPYVDLADLCLTLVREGGDVPVADVAEALGDVLISPRPRHGRAHGAGLPLVVEHGRNSGNTARLNGISLYAPHVAGKQNWESVRPRYQEFTFAQRTRWSELVHTFARLS